MRAAAAVTLMLLAPLAGVRADEQQRLRDRVRERRAVTVTFQVEDAASRPAAGVELSSDARPVDVKLGCNIFMWGHCPTPELEQAYRARFAELFDYATLPFYWWSYEPEPGQTREDYIRQVSAWCRAHGIVPKGHPLLWNHSDPAWLGDDVDENARLALQRVHDCVLAFGRAGDESRYPSRIEMWDVVNEASQFERCRERAPRTTAAWQKIGKLEMTRQAFARARAANSRATLLINDYDTSNRYAELIEGLRSERRGRPFPFEVIGIQSHMHGGVWPSQKVSEVCERFARFGLPLHFTEVTILSGEPGWDHPQPWPTTPEGEARQAREVERFYLELLACPAVEAITWWDLSDAGAWRSAPAGLLRKDMTPKPAYEVLKELKSGLTTRVSGVSGADGRVSCALYPGRYTVHASRDGRVVAERKVTVSRSAAHAPIVIRLGGASRTTSDGSDQKTGPDEPPAPGER
jgi:endo-1,4-beta-xylanase